ncbi:hypothetical protein [Xylanimonas protaetiae]|uniref:Uncharacterized protein n=1 Tax=Xylanimonas protaetiae TaxID=2509457 RepID=A0A4V0YFZ0_9MICO|nr:hypothetical protein [Xylanimonas protaetiae]QAY69381.1 hypothetical protein ET471_04430 [Xylanimonas protaetiae]
MPPSPRTALDGYRRTLDAGLASDNVQLRAVVDEIEPFLTGTTASTQFYAATRVATGPPPALRGPRLPVIAPGPALGTESLVPSVPSLPEVRGLGDAGTLGTVAPLSGAAPSSARGGSG